MFSGRIGEETGGELQEWKNGQRQHNCEQLLMLHNFTPSVLTMFKRKDGKINKIILSDIFLSFQNDNHSVTVSAYSVHVLNYLLLLYCMPYYIYYVEDKALFWVLYFIFGIIPLALYISYNSLYLPYIFWFFVPVPLDLLYIILILCRRRK